MIRCMCKQCLPGSFSSLRNMSLTRLASSYITQLMYSQYIHVYICKFVSVKVLVCTVIVCLIFFLGEHVS